MESLGYPTKQVGVYGLDCALCDEEIPIPVFGGIDTLETGRIYLKTYADTSVMWLHLWTVHPEYAAGEERHE